MASTTLSSPLNFSAILESGEYSDLKLLVGPDEEEFNVHRAIVCPGSTFFAAACRGNFSESQTNIIRLPALDPAVIRYVLQYLYAGHYPVPFMMKNRVIDSGRIFSASVFLGIDGLKVLSIGYITEGFKSANIHDKKEGYIAGLGPEARRKFEEKFGIVLRTLLEELYSNSSKPDRNFPEFQALLEEIGTKFDLLIKDEGFQDLVLKHGEIGLDIAKILHTKMVAMEKK